MNIKQTFKITVIRTGEVKIVKSNKLSYNTTKKYYPDILPGEYYNPSTIRFYSPKKGYILTSILYNGI